MDGGVPIRWYSIAGRFSQGVAVWMDGLLSCYGTALDPPKPLWIPAFAGMTGTAIAATVGDTLTNLSPAPRRGRCRIRSRFRG